MNKTALITGASRGIGRAIAEKFAREGYHLVLNSFHHPDLLEKTAIELEKKYSVSCLAVCGDIGDDSFVLQLFDKACKRFPSLDVLVNNAGISHVGLLSDMSAREWNQLINTNLSSAFYCCKCAIPRMVSQKSGKIIQISSVWGCIGASCETAYSASKGGLNSFTMALAKELAPSNIQVNAIACGAIHTEMNSFLSEEERTALTDEIPAGRFGTPEEVAELAFDLCKGHSYLTGQILRLDGGWI